MDILSGFLDVMRSSWSSTRTAPQKETEKNKVGRTGGYGIGQTVTAVQTE
jgi:hypothetical protein